MLREINRGFWFSVALKWWSRLLLRFHIYRDLFYLKISIIFFIRIVLRYCSIAVSISVALKNDRVFKVVLRWKMIALFEIVLRIQMPRLFHEMWKLLLDHLVQLGILHKYCRTGRTTAAWYGCNGFVRISVAFYYTWVHKFVALRI